MKTTNKLFYASLTFLLLMVFIPSAALAAESTITVNGDKAVSPVKFTVVGQNNEIYQKTYYTNDASKIPAVGTVAHVPYRAVSSHSKSSTIYLSSSASATSYTRTVPKVGNITETVYFRVYVVKTNSAGQKYWASNASQVSKSKAYKLKGSIYYNAYPAKSKSVYAAPGAKYPKYTPSKKGWKFAGWYTKERGGSRIRPGKTKVSFLKNTSYRTVYARWTKKITIKFDPAGGKISGSKSKTINFNALYGKMPVPKRTGYRFIGWYKVSGRMTNIYETTSTQRSYDAKTIKLKARWVKKGKGSSVTQAEWRVFKASRNYELSYNDAKAIFGGSGAYFGYYMGYPAYVWYGPRSYGHPGYNKVILGFSSIGNKGVFRTGQACTPFDWR